jgi:putative transcriptional regulator
MIELGSLIIASPQIPTGLYAKSVILICEHSDKGTVGIIINKFLPAQSQEEKNAIAKLEDHQIVTLLGGPLHPDEAFMLHNNPKLQHSSMTLAQNVFLGSMLPIDQQDKDHTMRLIFGYSAWGPKQLEKEIAKGFWIQTPALSTHIFSTPIDDQWHLILKTLGGRHQALANFPSRLDLN